jgi:ABC-2 type transport system ATP-binding protein
VVLEARTLTKRYSGVPAVRNVSFTVRPGEILGYLGPNGSGKTTTVNLIIGLLEPTGGEVLADGRDIRQDLVGFRRRVGYVPEEPNLYPFLSGREYLQLVGRLREIEARALDRRVEGLLELFGLGLDAEQSIGSYSKGMRQKILISAALLHDPDVLIFDEPLSGLDATVALVFKHLVRTLADRGKTILYSSHVLEVVERLCSRVIVLRRGEVVADDSVERLRELMSRGSLEEVFAELVVREDPERVARDIADVVAR